MPERPVTIASSSTVRTASFCLVVASCGFFFAMQAVRYQQAVQPGDRLFVHLVTAMLLGLATLAGIVVAAAVSLHFRRTLQATTEELIVSSPWMKRAYRWEDVSVSSPGGVAGFRRMTIATRDGTVAIEELFYPGFSQACTSVFRCMREERTQRRSVRVLKGAASR